METNEKKAYKLITKRNGITNGKVANGTSLHDLVKSMGGLVSQLPPDAKSALEDATLLEVAVRERKQKGLAPILFKAERARDIFALKAGDKKFSPLTYKRGYYIDKASPIKIAKAKDGTYVLTSQKGEVLAMANDAKTAQRQRVALSKASAIAPGKTVESKQAVPVAKSVDAMIEKSEYEKDMENLKHLQKTGYFKKLEDKLRDDNVRYSAVAVVASTLAPKFDFDTEEDLEKIAKKLPEWRRNNVDVMKIDDKVERWQAWNELESDKEDLATYGRDSDLDKLMADDWGNRSAAVGDVIALRGRDKDLDKLVNSTEPEVRAAVALNGRDKDLDKLINDPDHSVRSAVALHGREEDLGKLVGDKDWHVRETVAQVGRDEDLDKLVKDKFPSVRAAVAKRGRDQDLGKLASDKDWHVRNVVSSEKAASQAAEKEDEGPEL